MNIECKVEPLDVGKFNWTCSTFDFGRGRKATHGNMKFGGLTYDGVFDIVRDHYTYYDRLCPVVAACVNVVLSTCCEHYEGGDEGG